MGSEDTADDSQNDLTGSERIFRLLAHLRKGSAGIVTGSELTEAQKLLYSETSLDKNFWKMLKEENPDLVIVSGNAGDGKTTFMRKIREKHGDTVNSRNIKWNFDATHSDSPKKGQIDNLLLYFAPFADERLDTAPKDLHIIAMNTGMVLSFFEEARDLPQKSERKYTFSIFEKEVKSKMNIPGKWPPPENAWDILVLDLGRRELFRLSRERREESLIYILTSTFVNLDLWKTCSTCDQADYCFIRGNIELLREKSVVEFLEYLVRRAAYSSGLHFTIRDFWEFLTEAVGGKTSLLRDVSDEMAQMECHSFIQTLYQKGMYGEIMSSFLYNSIFQKEFMKRSGGILDRAQEVLEEVHPGKYENVSLSEALRNPRSGMALSSDAPRLFRSLLPHDPASLTGREIDNYAERVASAILGPEREISSLLDGNLLSPERGLLEVFCQYIWALLTCSLDPELSRSKADRVPPAVREITELVTSILKRRLLFMPQSITGMPVELEKYYADDYVFEFIKNVIIPARDYVSSNRENAMLKGKLLSPLLTDLLPQAIVTSEGLGADAATKKEFFISVDPKTVKSTLPEYIGTTRVSIDDAECEIYIGSSFEPSANCIQRIEEYDLFEMVPMEVYLDLKMHNGGSTEVKIDYTTYDLLMRVADGQQPSFTQTAKYRNFSVIKEKLRMLSLDRSSIVFFDRYGSRIMEIAEYPYSMNKWKIEKMR